MPENVHALPEGAKLNSGGSEYTVVKVLGAGGFGVTYLVTTRIRHGNVSFQVNMALKEHFRSNLCSRDGVSNEIVFSEPVRGDVENSLKDFLSEARRLQSVGSEHRNIVKVNEVFQANNTAYYVMEFLEGDSLRNYVNKHGALTQEQMEEVMRPIVDAVSYLHFRHMTHLDIKPDNIIVTRNEDGTLRPVLIDFGLAKHYTDDGHPTSTINTLGCSDGYAPAEQYAGITTFSPKADIYALAATILYCLTGNNPRKSTELSRGELQAILDKLNISDELRASLINAMAYNPMDRTETAAAVIPGKINTQAASVSSNSKASAGSPTVAFSKPNPQYDSGKTQVISKDSPDNNLHLPEDYWDESPRRPWLKYGIIAAGVIACAICLYSVFIQMSSNSFSEFNPEEEVAQDTCITVQEHQNVYIAPENQQVQQQTIVQEAPTSTQTETPQPAVRNSEDTYAAAVAEYNSGHYRRAKELFESISSDSRAQNFIGCMYKYGQGVNINKNEAIHWFQLAANQGNPDGQYNIGAMNIERDNFSEAIRWLRLAANQEHSSAQNLLGFCYFYGHGVSQDISQAIHWFRISAEQGDVSSQEVLGQIYEKGMGVSQNIEEAIKWYQMAAENGYSQAQESLRRLGAGQPDVFIRTLENRNVVIENE